MWHFISEQISQQIGKTFVCENSREMSNTQPHTAFKITDGKWDFFVKLKEKSLLTNFVAEMEGLEHLHNTQLFKVPTVICSGTVSNHSFLVLEYLSLDSGNETNWFTFGQQLAKLHQLHTQNMYGWQEDNFIGPTPQPNRWQKKWSTFFSEQRIGYMLQLLAEKGYVLANIDKAVAAASQLLAGHNPAPSMLHGDLWKGNTGFYRQQPVIFDPAFYFGDRETDVAMTELFNRFPQRFYDGYQELWSLDLDYQYRRPIYQLYHTLNHALVFGGHYLQSAKSTLNNLVA